MTINFKVFKALVIINVLPSLFVFVLLGIDSFYSMQVGFVSSSLILFASMKSYTQMISKRVANMPIYIEMDKDNIDKIEDPYDLYSEEIVENEEIENITEEAKTKEAPKRSFIQAVKDTISAFSFYRISSYMLLVFGFLYLHRHQMLNIPAYLLALALPILVLVFILLGEIQNEEITTD